MRVMPTIRVHEFEGFKAADAECENCGRTRRFWGRELQAYAARGHTIESFGRKLACEACRERGRAFRNVNLVLRPIEPSRRSA